jgi:hypothetical protein
MVPAVNCLAQPDSFRDDKIMEYNCKPVINAEKGVLVCCCSPDNDLCQVLKLNGIKCSRYDTPNEAIHNATDGGGVLLLSDDYPAKTLILPDELFDLAEKKRLRLYIEYPDWIPGLDIGPPQKVNLERGVITSGIFGSKLPLMRIVVINDCHFVPVSGMSPFITLAKVAGFDKAVYGLPDAKFPILFEHPDRKIMVSATKLSQFVTARYAPSDAWNKIWSMILNWLRPDITINDLKWEPVVGPGYSSGELLPQDAERQAIRKALEWIGNARMLIHPSWKDKDWGIKTIITPGNRGINENADQRYYLPEGDGSEGILEGFKSKIYFDGRQPVQWVLRSDCSGEQAAAFILGGILLKKPDWITIGRNLLNFSLFKFDAKAPWHDRDHPAFGLIGFYCAPELVNPWINQSTSFFGAINSRICMSALTSAGILNEHGWDDRVLQVMLANYRTTGKNGLREDALSPESLKKNGWHYYFHQSNLPIAPFPSAQLLAMNLVIYKTTGYKPLLEKTKKALKTLMDAYPDKWRFYNGMQQDRARMLLPLAWLVRVDDTPEHRKWLTFMTNEFIRYQDSCGAITEELGRGSGTFPEQSSNDTYGISETSLIQENGDPVCDLLYTLNSGFASLHEVVTVTGDAEFRKAEDKLAQFLCRIQTRSSSIPELDGTWFRSFDFDRWEYWGSNGDSGWGAWCVENGWIQGSVVTTFALRELKTCLWDLMIKRPLGDYLQKNLDQLLGDQ